MTLEQLAQYDCGSKPHPRFPEQQGIGAAKPLLSDIIEAADLHAMATNRLEPIYNVEIKSRPEWDGTFHPRLDEYVILVIDVIEKMGISNRVVIQSFDKRCLQFAHAYRKNLKLALLVEDDVDPAQHIRELGFLPQVYSCEFSQVDQGLIDYCRKQKMEVIPSLGRSMKEQT